MTFHIWTIQRKPEKGRERVLRAMGCGPSSPNMRSGNGWDVRYTGVPGLVGLGEPERLEALRLVSIQRELMMLWQRHRWSRHHGRKQQACNEPLRTRADARQRQPCRTFSSRSPTGSRHQTRTISLCFELAFAHATKSVTRRRHGAVFRRPACNTSKDLSQHGCKIIKEALSVGRRSRRGP